MASMPETEVLKCFLLSHASLLILGKRNISCKVLKVKVSLTSVPEPIYCVQELKPFYCVQEPEPFYCVQLLP